MNYSLNQLDEKLREFAETHLQIKDNYAFGELEEISNRAIDKFPLMFVILQPGTLGQKNVEVNMKIIIADLTHPDQSNRLEVWSDTLRIGSDLRAFLTNPDYDDWFTIEEDNIPYYPFSERFNDNTTGHAFDFKFYINDQKDRCAIPIE